MLFSPINKKTLAHPSTNTMMPYVIFSLISIPLKSWLKIQIAARMSFTITPCGTYLTSGSPCLAYAFEKWIALIHAIITIWVTGFSNPSFS
jgi:hypothetical protein